MGRRGPAPTPSAILKARGSWRGKANPGEPQPENGAPERPTGLSTAASKVWAATIAVVGVGVLTRDNGQTLARYCHGLVRWWKLAKWLDANEETYSVVDAAGNERFLRHPNLITYERLSRDLLRLEQEFGLTSASRTRITAIAAGDGQKKKKTKAGAAPVMRIAQ